MLWKINDLSRRALTFWHDFRTGFKIKKNKKRYIVSWCVNNELSLGRNPPTLLHYLSVSPCHVWLCLQLMSCQILPVFHKEMQGNLEGESSSLSEVTKGFSSRQPFNYRPISLPSNSNKLLEKLMFKRVNWFFLGETFIANSLDSVRIIQLNMQYSALLTKNSWQRVSGDPWK